MNNFTKRLIFGALYVVLIVIATTTNVYLFYGLFLVFMLFSIYEFQKMISLKSSIPTLLGLILFFASFLNNTTHNGKVLFLLGLLVFFSSFITTLLDKNKHAIIHLGKIALTIAYTIIPFILLIEIPFLDTLFNPILILGSFILVWTSDTFAYLIGRKFGKNKLFERISPNKTIEGFFGGVFFTVIVAYVLSVFFKEVSLFQWGIISIIISIFGVLGDLIESMFKRETKVKDSSSFIPGHGGFLDRLDSIIFATPFLYVFIYITSNQNLF